MRSLQSRVASAVVLVLVSALEAVAQPAPPPQPVDPAALRQEIELLRQEFEVIED